MLLAVFNTMGNTVNTIPVYNSEAPVITNYFVFVQSLIVFIVFCISIRRFRQMYSLFVCPSFLFLINIVSVCMTFV